MKISFGGLQLTGPGLIVLMLLTGCASTVPYEIRQAPDHEPPIEAVLNDPDSFAGRSVRWGGEIKTIVNQADVSRIEVIHRALVRGGYPDPGSQSRGRFIAIVDGFVDPEEAREGRLVTLFGDLEGAVEQLIGEYAYVYPEVRVRQLMLWSPRPAQPKHYHHHWPWYDRWYDPWYGPWRRPWYSPHPWHHPYRYR